MKSALVPLLSCVLLSACASIASDSNYPVTIESVPPGASVVVRDAATGEEFSSGTTPFTVGLPVGDGYFGTRNYNAHFNSPAHPERVVAINYSSSPVYAGNLPWVSPAFDRAYIGNIFFGGLIGFFVVDPLTGAWYKLPSALRVDLANGHVDAAPQPKDWWLPEGS